MLPRGTVTFLFTDIEGSTRRWEEDPGAMTVALANHNRVLDHTMRSQGGTVFKTIGDAYCVAFGSAEEAASAALEAHQSLATGGHTLRIRIALHSGAASPTGDDYFGPPLNRVARILAVTHAGQTVMSGSTRELLSATFETVGLGEHFLKDISEPIRLWQLGDGDFPPPPSLGATPNNLPIVNTTFLGREEELMQIRVLASRSRLLTLTGTGGTGKTRLAIQYAAERLQDFPDGVWLCELASLGADDEIDRAVADVVCGAGNSAAARDRLCAAIAQKTVCVILDNCEHVLVKALSLTQALLARCRNLQILVTSREPFGASGEATFRVPSLPVPDAKEQLDADSLRRYTSLALFIDRFQATASGEAVLPEQYPVVAKICRRLDGIPLAIELAAARGRTMSFTQIEKRLDDRFRLLTGGSRGALSRQQTLHALIQWSVDLLSPAERNLLLSLSVFSDGWDLEAAEEVCQDPASGAEPFEVLDHLTALVDKSLVVFRRSNDRYSLLESVRQFALEEQVKSLSAGALRDRHAEFFLQVLERLGNQSLMPDPLYRAFARDYENCVSAIDWSAAQDLTRVRALLAICGCDKAFTYRGRPFEFLQIAVPLYDRATAQMSPEQRLRVKFTIMRVQANCGSFISSSEFVSNMAELEGMPPELIEYGRRCLAYCVHINSPSLALECLEGKAEEGDYPVSLIRGHCCLRMGLFDEARLHYDLVEQFCLAGSDTNLAVMACGSNAMVSILQRDLDSALSPALRCNQMITETGYGLAMRCPLLTLAGELAAARNDWRTAALCLHGSDALSEVTGTLPLHRAVGYMEHLRGLVSTHLDATESDRLRALATVTNWEPWFQSVTELDADAYAPRLREKLQALIDLEALSISSRY